MAGFTTKGTGQSASELERIQEEKKIRSKFRSIEVRLNALIETLNRDDSRESRERVQGNYTPRVSRFWSHVLLAKNRKKAGRAGPGRGRCSPDPLARGTAFSDFVWNLRHHGRFGTSIIDFGMYFCCGNVRGVDFILLLLVFIAIIAIIVIIAIIAIIELNGKIIKFLYITKRNYNL